MCHSWTGVSIPMPHVKTKPEGAKVILPRELSLMALSTGKFANMALNHGSLPLQAFQEPSVWYWT